MCKADSRFVPSPWGMALLCNDVFHWLVPNLESALICMWKVLMLFSAAWVLISLKSLGSFLVQFASLLKTLKDKSCNQNQDSEKHSFLEWWVFCWVCWVIIKGFCSIHLKTIPEKCISLMCVKITFLKSLPNLPGASELMNTEFYQGNINMYLHFISFLHSEIAPVVTEILRHGGPQAVMYQSYTMRLLMIWQCKASRHQEPWYWPSRSKIIEASTHKDYEQWTLLPEAGISDRVSCGM